MTSRFNTFEGVASGTALTGGSGGNTGGASGDFLDVVQTGTGATATADSTHAAHGSRACKITTGATAALCFVEWTTQLGGTPGKLWFRVEGYFASLPAVATPIARFLTSGASQCARLVIGTGGAVQFNDGGNTQRIATVSTIPTGQWFRIEGFVTGSATVGQLEVKLFKAVGATVADDTKTSAATLNTTGAIGQVQYGQTSVTAANVSFWIDSPGASDAAYPGPVVSGSGAVEAAAAQAAGTGTETFSGSGAVEAAAAMLAGTGTEVFSGSGAVEAAAPELAGTGTEVFTGAAAVTAQRAQIAASGSAVPPVPGSARAGLATAPRAAQGTATAARAEQGLMTVARAEGAQP